MTYKEEIKDLFSVSEDYYLAHCISADFGMGKGIAVEFNKRFDMKHKLMNMFAGNVTRAWDYNGREGEAQGACFKVGRVLNLVTKRNCWQKPTYETLEQALFSMRDTILRRQIKKIAMPVIGCGLDRLEWSKVSKLLEDVLGDLDIEILVCKVDRCASKDNSKETITQGLRQDDIEMERI